jgi:hypothetical protein
VLARGDGKGLDVEDIDPAPPPASRTTSAPSRAG